MNIFYLSSDLKKCAQYHCDKHVVKMILEYAQLLSTACRESGLDMGYKTTHKNHPCAIWARSSEDNFIWLADLAWELNKEWQYRYEHPASKNHKSWDVISTLELPSLPKLGLTEFPQCMPDEFKVLNNPIAAYRNYYQGSKAEIATWKKRNKPWWFHSTSG